ncbi:MAG: hypothetical protein U0470_03970 [Anaerolineae bacterium]
MNERADYARSTRPPRSPHVIARVAAKARALALIWPSRRRRPTRPR